jgi:hypothetical protein
MPKRRAKSSSIPMAGGIAAFRVSAQTPLESAERMPVAMFNPVIRMPVSYQPFQPESAADKSSRGSTPHSAAPSRSESPAPLTFIQELDPSGTLTPQPAAKRRRLDEKAPKYKFTNKRTPFSIHRPLKSSPQVHKDVWTNILCFSPPRFLLQARTVNSGFYDILSAQSIWRESRQRHLPQHPDCPETLTEMQYTDLLVGKGCQSSTCPRQNTTSTNWALLVRFCPDCLTAKTARIQDIATNRRHVTPLGNQLQDALPMTFYLSTSHRTEPRDVRETAEGTVWADVPRGSTSRFLKRDYDRLEAEYLQLLQDDPDVIDSWWHEKRVDTMRQMKQRIRINRFSLLDHINTSGTEVRNERTRFFIEKARQLDPPIPFQQLELFEAYQKALLTQNLPTERSWETLKAKILPYQADAALLSEALRPPDERRTGAELWDRIHDHRGTYEDLERNSMRILVPEQEFVIRLAREEFQECLDKGVSDSDLVLLSLKNVYDRYYASEQTQGLNFNGRRGPYQLSLDDARMILEVVIKKHVSPSSQRGVKIFSRFKCPGCVKEKGKGRLFTFEACFDHILNVHGRTVGESPEFWRFALNERPQRAMYWYRVLPFPWYTTRWPRCLPVLPEHQDAADQPPWQQDAVRQYVQETVNDDSAFAGRSARSPAELSDFLELFAYAAKVLRGVRLSGPALTRIALQYALDMTDEPNTPGLDKFLEAIPMFQDANPAMDFRFRCGICTSQPGEKASARHVKHQLPVHNLLSHWKKSHDKFHEFELVDGEIRKISLRRIGGENLSSDMSDAHWTEGFMALPNDTELLDLMRSSDEALAKEKKAIEEAENRGKAKRKPKAKATIIMATRSATEVFNDLFPRDETAA